MHGNDVLHSCAVPRGVLLYVHAFWLNAVSKKRTAITALDVLAVLAVLTSLAALRFALLCFASLHSDWLCFALLCCALLHLAALCFTSLCFAGLCFTLL